jgi:hypothetical protein
MTRLAANRSDADVTYMRQKSNRVFFDVTSYKVGLPSTRAVDRQQLPNPALQTADADGMSLAAAETAGKNYHPD